jgi:HK97 family phage major capsid protein
MEGTLALEQKLDQIRAEWKARDQERETATGAKLTEIQTKMRELQTQADALDVSLAQKHAGNYSDNQNEAKRAFIENDGLIKFARGEQKSVVVPVPVSLFVRKTNIDSAAVGFSTSGVLPIDRTPGIVPEARQSLRIRNLLSSRPTQLSLIDFVKVLSPMSRASIQTESQTKQENAETFTTGTARVQTIASTIPASRQVLDDLSDLLTHLQIALPYYVNLAEEAQFLTGSGTGTDLNGLVTQATAFNVALLPVSPGWTKSDVISAAIQQLMVAKEVDPTFVVLHPTDFWNIRRTKNSLGQYLFGNNSISTDPFWGLNPVVTTTIGSGTFLVGSGNPVAVEIRDRMEMTVELSTQHASFFTSNQVMIRAEKRVTLVVYRPASFITGTFTTSP